MARRRGGERTAHPHVTLGVAPDASVDEIESARRRLAKRAHPDVGGSVHAMQEINAAADDALRQRRHAGGEPAASAARPTRVVRDHPSFTIEALPVEAFEGLLVVASWLGEVVDDDPPYALDVVLVEPLGAWCRLDLVPDAGATSVSLAVAAAPGGATPDVDRVRDAWIDGLNRLDWSDHSPRPPW